MHKGFTILIADRNPHVREFLRREMGAEGYRIKVAESGWKVLEIAYHHEPLDLLLLDPDFSDMDGLCLLKKLQDRIPTLPVVVHTFMDDYKESAADFIGVRFVEKKGNSIEHLKPIVQEMLQQFFPSKVV